MKLTLKGYLKKQKDGEILGIASTSTPDRDGESIVQEGWDLKNFKKNPVILASHNYREFPIGKATRIKVEEGKLMFKMIFSKATQPAIDAYELVKEGILNTFSVGFIPREYDAADQKRITKSELLEISLVSVPANPEAVVMAKGMKDNELVQKMIKGWLIDNDLKEEVAILESKTVIPYSVHGDSAMADEGMAWDGPAETGKATPEQLKKMSAWYDSEKPEAKTSYKLPHHLAEGNKVVMRGVMAAMAALMGARGGADIPDGDRKGVYNHLAKHMKQFDRKPPEFRFIEDITTSGVLMTNTENKVGVGSKALPLSLLKKVTGNLQELCRQANVAKNGKGGENK